MRSLSVWVCEDADRAKEVEKTKPDVNSECVSSRSAPESSGRDQHANTYSREGETGASEAGNTHFLQKREALTTLIVTLMCFFGCFVG